MKHPEKYLVIIKDKDGPMISIDPIQDLIGKEVSITEEMLDRLFKFHDKLEEL